MKLYYHPVSSTSRMVWMCAVDQRIELEYKLVDILTGEHLKTEFAAINPSRMVPVLEDGDFRLTESATILRYIAEKAGSPAYPKDVKARARVNEMTDWFNSNLYKDWGYGLIYPQLFPHHKRRSDEAQTGALEFGKQKACEWLKILDESLIGPQKAFLCGDQPTVADYFGAEVIALGDIVRCDLSAYPNILRWVGNMRALKGWPEVHQGLDGFVAAMKDKPFVAL